MLGAEAGATEKETGQKETARVERNNGDGGARSPLWASAVATVAGALGAQPRPKRGRSASRGLPRAA